MVFVGIGSGLTRQMTTTIAQNSVGQHDIGAASGVVTLLRTLGGCIAVAVFGTVYTAHTIGLSAAALSGGAADGVRIIFAAAAAAAVVAAGSLAAALAVKQLPLRGRPAIPTAPAPVLVTATR